MLGSSAPQDDLAATNLLRRGFFLEIRELPNVKCSGAAPWSQPGFFQNSDEVRRTTFLRIHRKDGTSKLLLGVTGSPPKVGSVKQIKVAQDEVLTIRSSP
jgi:hypothetical protein